MRKYIVWLVLLALLLAGCNTQPPEISTAPPTTTTVPATTLPLASDIYNEAVSAIGENVTATITVENEVSVGNSKIPSSAEMSVTYLGLGSEDLSARAKQTATYGEYTTEISEIYQSGVTYATILETKFSQEMTAEEYLARCLPVVLLDAALYETITMDGDTITFADATALESWLPGELISASGTAKLQDGMLTEFTYNATYKVGSIEQTVAVKQTLAPATSAVTTNVNSEDYTAVESIDAVTLLEQAYGYLWYAKDISARRNNRIISNAAAYYLNVQTNIHTWSGEDSPMMKIEQDISGMDYNTNSAESAKVEELFLNGKYTISQDGGRPTANSAVTQPLFENYYREMLTEYIMDLDYLKTAKLSAVSGAYLAEFTLTDEYGQYSCEDICNSIFGDPDLLNNFASAYRNEELTFYLAVDQYTYLPTALGYYYEGIHTIDGLEYPLTQQVDYYIDAASLESYEAIKEEPSPDAENEGATPLLYHVTGDNGQEMWLFGTIHVGDSRTGSLPKELYDAFAASKALAIECNTEAFEEQLENDEELSQKVSEAYFYNDGSTTKDHITDETLYEDAVKIMKASGNYHGNLPYMKPSVWESAIDNFYLRLGYHLTSDKGMESRLMLLAEQQDKPIWEVESTLFQLEMTTGYSDALQEDLLKGSVYADPKEYWESVDELYALWCAGDEAALIEQLRDDTSELTEEEMKLYEEYNTAMSTNRNAGMLEVAKQYLESGDTVFYAVGLAHLLVEDGLVFTLRDAGYTVTLVQYQ